MITETASSTKMLECTEGDPTCDTDGCGNGKCTAVPPISWVFGNYKGGPTPWDPKMQWNGMVNCRPCSPSLLVAPPALHKGRLKAGEVRVETRSGIVRCRISDSGSVAVAQPAAKITEVAADKRAEIISVLGISERDLLDLPILNATTSRTKTLVPISSPMVLNDLKPNFSHMRALCESIGSTGLYPFACDWDDERTYHARQFPAASGFPEDAATGVAATALLFGLKHWGLIGTRRTIRVRQGDAMGRPSRMAVTLGDGADSNAACWLSGEVRLSDPGPRGN